MLLLNPGPVTLSERVRRSLLQPDLCHRESEFFDLQDEARRRLLSAYSLDGSQWSAVLMICKESKPFCSRLSTRRAAPAVTHIAVMEQGRIVQMDEPRAIYFRPASGFVASFIGSSNLFSGVCTSGAGVGETAMVRLRDDSAIECLFPTVHQGGAVSVCPPQGADPSGTAASFAFRYGAGVAHL